jgi:hypothetical protein
MLNTFDDWSLSLAKTPIAPSVLTLGDVRKHAPGGSR